jgi:hypothetical protein
VDTGDSGNSGNTGDTGNTGNTGDTGNTGNTGDIGNTGNTGDIGDDKENEVNDDYINQDEEVGCGCTIISGGWL